MDISFDQPEPGARGVNGSKVHATETVRKGDPDDQSRRMLVSQANPQLLHDDTDTLKGIEKVIMGSQLFDDYPQSTYVCVLMDLLAYNHVSLTNKSFSLLVKFFNQRTQLINILKQVQILEQPESIKILREVSNMMAELKNFSESLNQWMDQDASDNEKVTELSIKMLGCKESIDYMSGILVHKKNIKRKQMHPTGKQSSIFDEIPKSARSNGQSLILDYNGIIKKHQDFAKGEIMPNSENQKLLRNLSIHEIILQILKINVSKAQDQKQDYQDLIMSLYLFLVRF